MAALCIHRLNIIRRCNACAGPSAAQMATRAITSLRRFTGEHLPGRCYAVKIGSGDGAVVGQFLQSKQTEELLRASEARFAISRIFRRTSPGRPTRSTASPASCTGGLGGAKARVSASLGVSIFPDDAGDAATLMAH